MPVDLITEKAVAALAYAIWDSEHTTRLSDLGPSINASAIAQAREIIAHLRTLGHDVTALPAAAGDVA